MQGNSKAPESSTGPENLGAKVFLGQVKSYQTTEHIQDKDSRKWAHCSQARWASRAMVMMVLPRPISSASMPLMRRL